MRVASLLGLFDFSRNETTAMKSKELKLFFFGVCGFSVLTNLRNACIGPVAQRRGGNRAKSGLEGQRKGRDRGLNSAIITEAGLDVCIIFGSLLCFIIYLSPTARRRRGLYPL